MKKSTRIKVTPIANTTEFHATVSELARLELQARTINLKREDELQRVNKIFDQAIEPIAEKMKGLGALALAYAEAHRDQLLPKGAKSVGLSFATYGWRTGNRTVGLLSRVTVEHVINALKAAGLGDAYVVTKEELSRAKILADCKDDKTLPYQVLKDGVVQDVKLADFGLKISQTESFYVEPVSATDAAETIKPEVAA